MSVASWLPFVVLIVALPVLAILALSPLFAFVSIIATDGRRWAATGRRKVPWAIACWLTGPIASILYLTKIRPQLLEVPL